MISIRTFEGDVAELREFVVSSWGHDYAGKMAYPLWPNEYFDWQLGLSAGVSRNHLIAAYDENKLVGCVLGIPYQFRIPAGIRKGTVGSWLSVAPEARRLGIASQLKTELLKRHADEGAAFQVGYRYFGSKYSKGKTFWKNDPLSSTQFLGKVGFWIRILDAPRAAAWNYSRLDRIMIRLAATWYPGPKIREGTVSVRPYTVDDLDACVALIQKQTSAMTLAMHWEADTLGRHLHPDGFGRSLVAERDGKVVGFVGYHSLPFQGLTVDKVGVIDVIQTEGMSFFESRCLIDAMLLDLKKLGAVVAIKLRVGDYPAPAMMSLGFVPRPTDSHLVVNWATERSPIPTSGIKHVIWR